MKDQRTIAKTEAPADNAVLAPAQPEETAPAPGPETKAIEVWAEERKMLPEFVATKMGNRSNPEYWKFRAAKQHMGWSDGQAVTAEEFSRGVAEQDQQRHGSQKID